MRQVRCVLSDIASTGPIVSTNIKAVTRPTPGCSIKSRAAGFSCASLSTARSNSVSEASSRSRMADSSRRRRLAHGSNAKASSSVRPLAAHNLLFRYTSWPMASACNWFLTAVRRQTILWRCRNSCRTSRSAGEGTQILGNRLAGRDQECGPEGRRAR